MAFDFTSSPALTASHPRLMAGNPIQGYSSFSAVDKHHARPMSWLTWSQSQDVFLSSTLPLSPAFTASSTGKGNQPSCFSCPENIP